MLRKLFFITVCWGLALTANADNAINLVLTKGTDKALPIAVVPFDGQAEDGAGNDNIAGVISADLRFSGQFKVSDFATLPAKPHTASAVNASIWRKTGVDNVVVGAVSSLSDGRVQVNFALVDVTKGTNVQTLIQQTYQVKSGQTRALAHHIADVIFKQLIGVRGIFSTRIAYVLVKQGDPAVYSLQVADADGFNPRPILTSNEPIMSPAWSPDGKKLAYVSFEGRRAQIYIADIATGQRQRISAAPGINGAPAWSPDGRKLALVLSKTGAPKIYLLNLGSGQLQQLTTGPSIDTEPNFAPDGQSILFTSDRGGSPQLYRLSLGSGKISRITYSGNYNARGSFSRDGKQVAMINRQDGQYNIAVQELASGNVSILTHSGRDDSPTLAPNGMMILYGNEFGELGLVSTDGRVKLRVPGKNGKVQDPAWSPFLN